ncbi:segregation and condensation protein A [Hyphococcus luteus]|nr:ScpA family protein [Marinicaulis flavus]
MADGEHIPQMAAPVNEAEPENGAENADAFDEPVRVTTTDEAIDALVVNIEGYEGPLDVLLDLARHQKVDIRKISMVALVDQYLQFVEAAKERNLELAADYLVMASWLAFLKSKMLLPAVEDDGDEPTADEMAARLAFQLQRLEAMRKAVDDLQALPQEGIDFFPRGAPEGVRVTHKPDWQADLLDLLKAYATQRIAAVDRDYHIEPPAVFSIEAARARLERILGSIPEWTELSTLTKTYEAQAPGVSVLASSFNAALEFAKAGRIHLRQVSHFEPIYIKARPEDAEEGGPVATDEGDGSQ